MNYFGEFDDRERERGGEREREETCVFVTSTCRQLFDVVEFMTLHLSDRLSYC